MRFAGLESVLALPESLLGVELVANRNVLWIVDDGDEILEGL